MDTLQGVAGKDGAVRVIFRETYMKVKIVSFLCAVALAMVVPAMAFAAEFSSPSGASATDNDTTLHVSGDVDANGGFIVVEGSDTPASNAVIKDGDYSASFEVHKEGDITTGELTLTFNVPPQYIGANAIIYITYPNGETAEFRVVIDSRGIATVVIPGVYGDPTYITIVIDAATATGPQDGGRDTSATSPQTGVGVSGAYVAGSAMLAVACGLAVVLRKKSNA